MINPGELALATIGVSALIKGDVPKQGIGRLKEMARLPAQIDTLASKVADGTLEYSSTARAHDYKQLLSKLAKPLPSDAIVSLVAKFPHEASDIAGSFVIAAQQALTKIRDLFPVSVYKSFVGPVNLVPNDLAVWQFMSQLDVLNDPLRVFSLMATGALLKRQVDAVRAVYPTLSDAIDSALYRAIVADKAKKASYQLPPRSEIGVAVWLGRKIAAYKPPAKDAPATPADSTSTKLNKGELTANQAAVNAGTV